MNFVNTVAPIPIEELKKYFIDKTTFYNISYKDSTLKGSKLLTYLSNLEVPCDIHFQNDEEALELLKEYLSFSMIVDIPSLEYLLTDILIDIKSDDKIEEFQEFINNNKDVLMKWVSKLDSLTLYNMYIINIDEFKDYIKEYECDETDSTEGINFVSLLKNEYFYNFYSSIDKSNLKYYKTYFDEYMFKGKNLFSYWATENNPMFLLNMGIAENLFTTEDYNNAKAASIQELSNAALI
jgi:hypothetical protein